MVKMINLCMEHVACKVGEKVMKMLIYIFYILEMETLYLLYLMAMVVNRLQFFAKNICQKY